MSANQLSSFFSILLCLILIPAVMSAAPFNVEELILKVIKAEEENDKKAENYVYEEMITIEKLNKKGETKKTRTKKFLVISNPGITYELKSIDDNGEQIIVAGHPYESISTAIAVKGAPTPTANDAPKPERTKNAPLQYSESLQMAELVKRYDFTYQGEQMKKNSLCYVLSFVPSKKMKAKSKVQKVLNNLTGKIWVDKQAYVIKACEADLDTALYLAWPFATLRDLRITYLGTRLPNGVWMPAELSLETISRVFLSKSYLKQTAKMSDYRLLTPEEINALK